MRSKSEERRQLILEVAARTFTEVGYEKCSMSELAARVGGSKATLYNYFASKEELFLAVTLRSAEQLRNAFEGLRPGDDAGAALRAFGREVLPGLMSPEVIATLRMVQHEAGQSDAGRLFYDAGPRHGQQLLADFIADAIRRGQLRAGDPLVMGEHLLALLESEFRTRRLMGVIEPPAREETDAAAQRALDVFLAAYGPVAPPLPPMKARPRPGGAA